MSALDKLNQLQGSFDSQADEISDMINERSSAFSNAWRSKANEAVKLKDDAKEQLDELLATGTMGAQQLKGLYDRVKTVRANRAAIRAGTKSADIKPAAKENDFVSPEEGVEDDAPLFSDQGLGQRSSAIVSDDERANLSSLSRSAAEDDATRDASREASRAATEKATGLRAEAGGKSIGERVAERTAAESAAPEASSAAPSSSGLASIPEGEEDESASSSLFGDFSDPYRGDQFARMGFGGQQGSGGFLGRQPDVLERQAGSGGVDSRPPVQSSYSQAEDPTLPDGRGGAVASKASPPEEERGGQGEGLSRQRSGSMNLDDEEEDDDDAGASGGGASEAGGGASGDGAAGGASGAGGGAADADDIADTVDTATAATEGAEVGSSVALGGGTETAIGLAGDVLGPLGLIAGIGFGIFEALDTAHAKPHDPPPQEAVSTAASRHSLVLPSIDGVVDTPASMSAF